VSKELVTSKLKRKRDGNIKGLQARGDLQDPAARLCRIGHGQLLRGWRLSWVVCGENIREFAAAAFDRTSPVKMYLNLRLRRSIGTSLVKIYLNLRLRRSIGRSLAKMYLNLRLRHSTGTSLAKMYVNVLLRRSIGPSLLKMYLNLQRRRSIGWAGVKKYEITCQTSEYRRGAPVPEPVVKKHEIARPSWG
jgi:hypothetical protein